MSPATSNLSHDRQAVDSMGHSREVTQQGQTIDHAAPANGFTLGIFSGNAPARLVSAPTSASFARHGDSQAPVFDAVSLIVQGFDSLPLETLHNTAPEPPPIADLGRAIKAGGEGVEASARSQLSQYIPPRRKFPHCPRP
jgi:hypothetical protein